ncbi:hypothetical protein M3P05_08360 [Sansalvadorimonas sp. 2012CJ34-2]|uniref:Uncharacterized protein n=1 Tax=Parendozoicomonas callyspongiae TaxID=2942213 RepID=A0ABT0PEZ7_9GAMM|nr:hypothetical protein [Sansalvadorimonas sp. 2012CJ34-2]MCL6269949.1 hypothetical protein [Sansalvadorimonas sp. 2012CJ34-2]
MGQSAHVLSVSALAKLDIDYRLVACQERFRQVSHHINIQQLVEDFNRLRTTANLNGIEARSETISFIADQLDVLSVVEDLDSGLDESKQMLAGLINELYDLKLEPDTALAG